MVSVEDDVVVDDSLGEGGKQECGRWRNTNR